MRPISDGLLLTTAQIAATLIGLLLVAVFFWVETGLRRVESLGPRVAPFMRALTRLILLLYSLVLALSLALLALERVWIATLYALATLALIAALVEVTVRARGLPPEVRRRHGQVWAAWLPVAFVLALPWVADGLDPSREAFTWTLLLGGTLAFVLTAALLLLAFDLAAIDEATPERDS